MAANLQQTQNKVVDQLYETLTYLRPRITGDGVNLNIMVNSKSYKIVAAREVKERETVIQQR